MGWLVDIMVTSDAGMKLKRLRGETAVGVAAWLTGGGSAELFHEKNGKWALKRNCNHMPSSADGVMNIKCHVLDASRQKEEGCGVKKAV